MCKLVSRSLLEILVKIKLRIWELSSYATTALHVVEAYNSNIQHMALKPSSSSPPKHWRSSPCKLCTDAASLPLCTPTLWLHSPHFGPSSFGFSHFAHFLYFVNFCSLRTLFWAIFAKPHSHFGFIHFCFACSTSVLFFTSSGPCHEQPLSLDLSTLTLPSLIPRFISLQFFHFDFCSIQSATLVGLNSHFSFLSLRISSPSLSTPYFAFALHLFPDFCPSILSLFSVLRLCFFSLFLSFLCFDTVTSFSTILLRSVASSV